MVDASTLPVVQKSQPDAVAVAVTNGGAPPRHSRPLVDFLDAAGGHASVPRPAGITSLMFDGEIPPPDPVTVAASSDPAAGQKVIAAIKAMHAAAIASLNAGLGLAIPKAVEKSIFKNANGRWCFLGERNFPLRSETSKLQAELTHLGMQVVALGVNRTLEISPILKESTFFKLRNGYDISALEYLLQKCLDKAFVEVRDGAMKQVVRDLLPKESRKIIGFGYKDYTSSPDANSDEEEE